MGFVDSPGALGLFPMIDFHARSVSGSLITRFGEAGTLCPPPVLSVIHVEIGVRASLGHFRRSDFHDHYGRVAPEIEERFLAQAQARGLSLDAYGKEFLSLSATAPTQLTTLSPEEVNLLLDEAADLVPGDVPPLSDYAMSREGIYTREDEW